MEASASSSRYHEGYGRWQRDPEGFWAEAAKAIDWYEPATRVFDPSVGVYGRWFVGATCNTCHNAVDRHVEVPDPKGPVRLSRGSVADLVDNGVGVEPGLIAVDLD